jgi:hypothetical protein
MGETNGQNTLSFDIKFHGYTDILSFGNEIEDKIKNTENIRENLLSTDTY